MTTPVAVSRTELLEALRPFAELLGVDLAGIYTPIVIDTNRIVLDINIEPAQVEWTGTATVGNESSVLVAHTEIEIVD